MLKINIFERIMNFAYFMGKKCGLKPQLNEQDIEERSLEKIQEDIEICQFGFIFLFTQSLLLITMFLLMTLMNLTFSYFIFIPCICTLKMLMGGYHCENFARCFLTSIINYLVFIIYSILSYKFYFFNMMLSIIFFLLLLPYAPIPSENTPSRGEEDLKFRVAASFIGSLMILASFILLKYEQYFYINIISSAMLGSCFMVSKFGESIVETFWKIVDLIFYKCN